LNQPDDLNPGARSNYEEEFAEIEGKDNVESFDDDLWLHIISSGKRFITIDATLPSVYFEIGNTRDLELFIKDVLNQARAKIQVTIDEHEREELRKDRERKGAKKPMLVVD